MRISEVKRTFEKGYLPNYTEEVFRIHDVYAGPPYRYKLADLMDEEIKGRFVADEIIPANKDGDQIWKVEEAIKRDRQGRYLVN